MPDKPDRRAFLATAGRCAVVVPPTMLLSTAMNSPVVAAAATPLVSGNGLMSVRRNALGAAPLTLQAWLESRDLHVAEFGAVGDGVTNDRAAIQAAIDAARRAGGGNVLLGPKTYLIQSVGSPDDKSNGIVIGYTDDHAAENRVNLIGRGRSSVLKAGSRNMRVLRLSDSRCRIENLLIDGAGQPGVCGLSIVPEDTTQTSRLVYQQKNHIRQVEIRNCAEGLELKCGPDIRGVDSGCWLNKFYDLDITGCTRGIWMRNAPNAGGSGNNRNHFYGGRCGQSGSNTGLQIDSGQGNCFYGFEFEGIEDGRSPNATPTAIKIADTDTTTGSANESNRFIGGTIEACSADIVNANPRTELIGLFFMFSKCTFTARPATIVGGYDASLVPQVMGGGHVDLGLLVQADGQFGTLGSGTIHGGVVSKFGGMTQRRQAAGVAASVAPNIDHGGFTGATPPGGGAVAQDFNYAFSANRSALWLATATGVGARDNTKNATRASLFMEHSTGGFNEFNMVDSKNAIANSAISLSRSGNTITMAVTMSGGIGAEVLNVNFNLVRLN